MITRIGKVFVVLLKVCLLTALTFIVSIVSCVFYILTGKEKYNISDKISFIDKKQNNGKTDKK